MTYKRIRELREDHDLTQKYMAHYLNVIQRTYSRYERGERIIPPDVLCKIADFYNGAWSPTNAKSSMWTSCYQQIANCNLYLDEFTGLTFSEYELISGVDNNSQVVVAGQSKLADGVEVEVEK